MMTMMMVVTTGVSCGMNERELKVEAERKEAELWLGDDPGKKGEAGTGTGTWLLAFVR